MSLTHLSDGVLLERKGSGLDEISVYENEVYRWLKFGGDEIQSAQIKAHPEQLHLPYLQAMAMVNAMFDELLPRKVALLGLGGGSLSAFMSFYFPGMHQSVVEVSDTVVNYASRYFRWKLLKHSSIAIMDAREFLLNSSESYDVIYLDLFDQQGGSPLYDDEVFLQHCRIRLNEPGWAVFNLLPHDAERFCATLKLLRHIFRQRVLCLSIPGFDNVVVYAARHDYFRASFDRFVDRVTKISQRWNFPVTSYVNGMLHVNANDPYFKRWAQVRREDC